MAGSELILLDTSILIDFFRKKDKSKSKFYSLTSKYKLFAVSVITEYEIFTGAHDSTLEYWNIFFDKVMVLPLERVTTQNAVKIFKQLKHNNQLIEIPDILIGSTAIVNKIKLATLNRKHFERIEGLDIID
jgi:predicted nucleic acid-binding protein